MPPRGPSRSGQRVVSTPSRVTVERAEVLPARTRSCVPFAVKETYAPLAAEVRTVPAHAAVADADFHVPV